MWIFRTVGLVAVIGSLAACADDTDDAEATSQSTSHLSDPGLGSDVPEPQLPPGPWNDASWKAPPPPDREHDPVGPEARCGLGYQKIYDPARGRTIEVAVVLCE